MAIDEYAYMNAEVSSRLKDGMGIISGVNEMIKIAMLFLSLAIHQLSMLLKDKLLLMILMHI